MIHRLIVPLTLAALAVQAGSALAQGAFPAPLPNQAAPMPNQPGMIANDPAFPPVNGVRSASVGTTAPASPFPSGGAAPLAGGPGGGSFAPPAPPTQGGGGPSAACMSAFVPLRADAEKKGKLIQAAGERHAPPEEACKLIGNYSQAEVKMIRYVEANTTKCGIPGQVADQLKTGHKNTEALLARVCGVAEQMKNRAPAGPTLSEVLGSSTSPPEATHSHKGGGSTFDTLNGNVLQR
jgi:hypothetical protein